MLGTFSSGIVIGGDINADWKWIWESVALNLDLLSMGVKKVMMGLVHQRWTENILQALRRCVV